MGCAQRDGVVARGGGGDAFGPGDGGRVATTRQGQHVSASLQVDDPCRSNGGGEGDHIGQSAAGDGFSARHRDGVGAVGQGDGVGASAQVKTAGGYDAGQHQCIVTSAEADVGGAYGSAQCHRVCPCAAYDGFDAVQGDVVGAVGQGDLVCTRAGIDGGAGGGCAQCQSVGPGAAGNRLDIGDGGGIGEVPQGQRVGSCAQVDGGVQRAADRDRIITRAPDDRVNVSRQGQVAVAVGNGDRGHVGPLERWCLLTSLALDGFRYKRKPPGRSEAQAPETNNSASHGYYGSFEEVFRICLSGPIPCHYRA